MDVSVVTGATGGIGRWIALGLARAGHHVVLVGRDQARAKSVRQWIAAQAPQGSSEIIIADLSLLDATRAAAGAILSRHGRIHVLVNNAGIFDARRLLTREGHERVLATNLLSPILLTTLLQPALAAAAPSRIIAIGSSTSDKARLDPDGLELGPRWTMTRAYGQSKLALMMASFALAARLKGTGVVVNVVHPGLVATGLVRTPGIIGLVWRSLRPFARTEQQGADVALHVALDPQFAGISGAYIKNRRPVRPNPQALDPVMLERLWQATARLTNSPRADRH